MSADMRGKNRRSSRQQTPPREDNLYLEQELADFLDVGKDIHSHQEIWFYSHTSGAFQRAFTFLLDLDWSSATDSWHLMGLCVCVCVHNLLWKKPLWTTMQSNNSNTDRNCHNEPGEVVSTSLKGIFYMNNETTMKTKERACSLSHLR